MNVVLKDVLHAAARFLAVKRKRRLLLLAILGGIALTEFFVLGLAKRTFVFYTVDSEKLTVEGRMIKRSPLREVNITRYVEEALLGPASPGLLPLFSAETRLQSLLFRDGIVYAGFSEEAALPPFEGGEVLKNLRILYTGIQRNFPFVHDVRFFIAGKAAYHEEFRQIREQKRLE
jgi:hypothetical protein